MKILKTKLFFWKSEIRLIGNLTMKPAYIDQTIHYGDNILNIGVGPECRFVMIIQIEWTIE